MDRRSFIATSSAAIAFSGLQRLLAKSARTSSNLYGPLISDPRGLLDLPKGFSYRVISQRGQRMDDGFKVPGQPDGMACFPRPDGKIIIVRNHELSRQLNLLGPYEDNTKLPDTIDRSLVFDPGNDHLVPSVGGTTTLLYNPKTRKIEKQFLSLTGTDTNCAGGKIPTQGGYSWITCEETNDLTHPDNANHGWCFEVKADADSGLQTPVPLKALGRFRHEAVACDESTGILYLTEDRGDGLLYRFVPETKGSLTKGSLEALALTDRTAPDIRNYDGSRPQMRIGEPYQIRWIPLKDIHSPDDSLRFQGHKAGAKLFARGEGITILGKHIYVCCTDGGNRRQGQIFRITPGSDSDSLELFLQPDGSDLLTNGDNICVGPHNQLIICEDLVREHREKTPHVRTITPDGQIHTIARNALNRSEFAGSCFDPGSGTLFFNIQNPGITFAVVGPWKH